MYQLRGKILPIVLTSMIQAEKLLDYPRVNIFLFPLAVFMFLSNQRYFISEVEFCGNITEQIILENGDTFRLMP